MPLDWVWGLRAHRHSTRESEQLWSKNALYTEPVPAVPDTFLSICAKFYHSLCHSNFKISIAMNYLNNQEGVFTQCRDPEASPL